MRLVEVLCERGLITSAHLRSLVGLENLSDDQLAADLVNTGAITTDQLAVALGVLYGVPPALESDFARADPTLRKRLRAHQAANFQSIPLFVTQSRRVAVAMVNPANPKIFEELAFVLGASIEPMVAPEMVLARQLELLFAMPRRRTTGFNPIVTADGASSSWSDRTPVAHGSRVDVVPIAVNDGAYSQARSGFPSRPISAARPSRALKQTQSYLAAMNEMPTFTPARGRDPYAPSNFAEDALAETPIPPMVAITGPDAAVEQIASAPDRQSAADSLFAFMRSCFGAGAMFVVNGVFAEGRFGYNHGAECTAVESIVFSLSVPSCFRPAYTQGGIFHGPPPSDGQNVHRPLWLALGSEPPREVLVAPVIAAGQTALLLYAQGRKGGHMEKFAVNRMEHVAAALANTLVRLAGRAQ
jgi:hypothetical protein